MQEMRQMGNFLEKSLALNYLEAVPVDDAKMNRIARVEAHGDVARLAIGQEKLGVELQSRNSQHTLLSGGLYVVS